MEYKKDRVAFIIPYFGKLPNYFQLFLNSAGNNNDCADFLIFTDDRTHFQYPENCKVKYCEFKDIRERIKSIFDFDCKLDTPYKLCDYKPTYGDVFKEELKCYGFWGHCDIDLIFGNISKYIFENSNIFDYDRFLGRGPLSIYKNNEYVNTLYKELQPGKHMNYKDVYSTNNTMAFDEYAQHNGGGLTLIMKENGISVFEDYCYSTPMVELGLFKDRTNKTIKYYKLTNKKAEVVYKNTTREVMYVHMMKRKITFKERFDNNNYYIMAPGIVTSDKKDIKYHPIKDAEHMIRYFSVTLKNKIKRSLKKM